MEYINWSFNYLRESFCVMEPKNEKREQFSGRLLKKLKRDYEINENNGRSAGFQPACSKKALSQENMQAGSPRTGRYFRLFRNLSWWTSQLNCNKVISLH